MKPCCMGREERQEEPGGEARDSRDSAQPPTTGAGTGRCSGSPSTAGTSGCAGVQRPAPDWEAWRGGKKGEEGGPKGISSGCRSGEGTRPSGACTIQRMALLQMIDSHPTRV